MYSYNGVWDAIGMVVMKDAADNVPSWTACKVSVGWSNLQKEGISKL